MFNLDYFSSGLAVPDPQEPCRRLAVEPQGEELAGLVPCGGIRETLSTSAG